MNILFVSNFTTLSGYAIQARLLVPLLQALGHKVTVVDIRSGPGAMTAQIGDVTVLPTAYDSMGNDIILAHYQRSQADVVITLSDIWGFNAESMKDMNWWPITPVDHTPVPPAAQDSLSAAKGIIALSRFGMEELRKIGRDSHYMPLGLDPAIWTPALTLDDMRAARNRIVLDENRFVVSFVGVNDSNPSRKGISELLIAWSIFQPTHPDSLLLLHTTRQGNIPIAGNKNGVDVDAIITMLGIHAPSVLMPDQYRMRTGIPASELADMARASDVFILPSRGEGFGLPLIEFEHAGCPVITTNFAAGAELCASGWLIEGESEWSWQNATVLKPGIASIIENLETAYAERGNMARRVEAASFARDFEIDHVCSKYLAPTLKEIAETVILNAKVAA